MNKLEIETKIAMSTGISKKDVNTVLNNFLKEIEECLKSGENVKIVNFGTFSVTQRKERDGQNPSNGEKIRIPERKTPTFKAGKSFKKSINNL